MGLPRAQLETSKWRKEENGERGGVFRGEGGEAGEQGKGVEGRGGEGGDGSCHIDAASSSGCQRPV